MFGQDGWILAEFFFCEFMDLDFVSVHKRAKKELGQYPAVLTSHLVNNPYVPPSNSVSKRYVLNYNSYSKIKFVYDLVYFSANIGPSL